MKVGARGTSLDKRERRRAALLARAACKFVSSTGLATIALLAASTVSTRAQIGLDRTVLL